MTPELSAALDDMVKWLDGVITDATTERDRLRALQAPADGVRLKVPWASQLGSTANYAPGDCGSACVTMLLTYAGAALTVDQVSAATGKPRGFKLLGFDEMIAAAGHFGLKLKHECGTAPAVLYQDISAGKPAIALVDYRSLPAVQRFDGSYSLGHYLVLVGYSTNHVIYHDPYWVDPEGGAFRVLTRAEFDRAYSMIAAGNNYSRHCLRMA